MVKPAKILQVNREVIFKEKLNPGKDTVDKHKIANTNLN